MGGQLHSLPAPHHGSDLNQTTTNPIHTQTQVLSQWAIFFNKLHLQRTQIQYFESALEKVYDAILQSDKYLINKTFL